MSLEKSLPSILKGLDVTKHHLIEAHAGTGKTYTIEHLVLLLLRDTESQLENIAVVTFTEKATAELKQRIRRRLEQWAATETDPRLVHKIACSLSAFEHAPISTIHSFCLDALRRHSLLTRTTLEASFADSRSLFSKSFLNALREDFAREPDLLAYLNEWLASSTVDALEVMLWGCHSAGIDTVSPEASTCQFRFDFTKSQLEKYRADLQLIDVHQYINGKADKIARIGDVWAQIQREPTTPRALRLASEFLIAHSDDLKPGLFDVVSALPSFKDVVGGLFLPRVQHRVAKEKSMNGLLEFNDLMSSLWTRLKARDPDAEALASALRAQFHFAVVDEFQDTDKLQWEVFETLFLESGGNNVFFGVGDRKQAIYRFRGADIDTYKAARSRILEKRPPLELRECRRSTPKMIDAYNQILGGGYFRDRELYSDDATQACAAFPDDRLVGHDGVDLKPVVLLKSAEKTGYATEILQQFVTEIRDLIQTKKPTLLKTGHPERRLGYGDVLVLTRSRLDCEKVASALKTAGVPCNIYRHLGLFSRPEATEVLHLLEAIADPDDTSKRMKAWLTSFFHAELRELPALKEASPSHPLVTRLWCWHELAIARKFGDLFSSILSESAFVVRRLIVDSTETNLSCALQILEVLEHKALRSPCTIHELILQLRKFMNASELKSGLDDEEDANFDLQGPDSVSDAVQIMTIHASKGLEEAIVFIYGGFQKKTLKDRVSTYHDTAGHRRVAFWPAALTEIEAEEAEDSQRLYYVALTRPLARLYLPFCPEARITGAYTHVHGRLAPFAVDAELNPPASLFELCPCRPQSTALTVTSPQETGETEIDANLSLTLKGGFSDRVTALRRERRAFRVTSYSAIQRNMEPWEQIEEVASHSEPPEPGPVDDLAIGGAEFGVFIHAVLENVDFDSVERFSDFQAWCDDVRPIFEQACRDFGIAETHIEASQRLVHKTLVSPIKLASGARMQSLASAVHVLKEVEFLYPFSRTLNIGGRIKGVVPDEDLIKGFIDLVFEFEGKVYFLDWKTNKLPGDYGPEAVARVVADTYDIQFRLYALAIAKLIGIKNSDDFNARFGGGIYLFLRGVSGDGQNGIYHRCPTWDEIQDALGKEAA